LQRGVFKNSKFTALRQARLEVLLRAIPVIPFDEATLRSPLAASLPNAAG